MKTIYVEHINTRRYECCVRCGCRYNVSIDIKLDKLGYICPRCKQGKGQNARNENRNTNRHRQN